MTREYTTKILEMLSYGNIAIDGLVKDLLNWMSEDDVREFVLSHHYLSELVEFDEEDDEFDNAGLDFITDLLGEPSKKGLGLCWAGLANDGNTVTLFNPGNADLSLDDYIEFRDSSKSLGLPTDDWDVGFMLVKDVPKYLKRLK